MKIIKEYFQAQLKTIKIDKFNTMSNNSSKFKVSELIEKLKEFNPDAYVIGVYDYVGHDLLSVGFGGGDGCTKANCDEITLHFTDDNSEQPS